MPSDQDRLANLMQRYRQAMSDPTIDPSQPIDIGSDYVSQGVENISNPPIATVESPLTGFDSNLPVDVGSDYVSQGVENVSNPPLGSIDITNPEQREVAMDTMEPNIQELRPQFDREQMIEGGRNITMDDVRSQLAEEKDTLARMQALEEQETQLTRQPASEPSPKRDPFQPPPEVTSKPKQPEPTANLLDTLAQPEVQSQMDQTLSGGDQVLKDLPPSPPDEDQEMLDELEGLMEEKVSPKQAAKNLKEFTEKTKGIEIEGEKAEPSKKIEEMSLEEKMAELQRQKQRQIQLSYIMQGLTQVVGGAMGVSEHVDSKTVGEATRAGANIPVESLKEQMSISKQKRKDRLEDEDRDIAKEDRVIKLAKDELNMDITRRKLKKIEQQEKDDAALKNPKSQISILYKNIAKMHPGLKVSDKTSAYDLQQAGLKIPTLGKAGGEKRTFSKATRFNPETKLPELGSYDTRTGQYSWTGQEAGFAPSTRIDPETGQRVSQRQFLGDESTGKAGESKPVYSDKTTIRDLTPKDEKDLEGITKRYEGNNEFKLSNEAIAGARGAQVILAFGEKEGGDIQRSIQNMLARATGERGVMTENDVKPFGGRQAITARLQRLVQYQTLGEIPDEDRQFLTKFSKALEQAANNRLNRAAKPFLREAESRLGVSNQKAREFLNMDQRLTMPITDTNREKLAPPGSTVRVRGKVYKVGADGETLTEVK